MQKIVYPSYLFCSFHKLGSRDSGKRLQSTNWMVNAAIEFSRSIKLMQMQNLMKLFWWLEGEQLSLTRSGSKFYFKSYIF